MKKNEHLIKEVYPGSIAEEMGIEPGDVLLRINKQEIGDVFDYRYYIKDDYIEVLIRKADGEEWLLEIDKDYDDDLGIEFDNGLMSDYRSCSNKCIFCFIDQLPKNMRPTMYFKDDDFRLSLLYGNYVTLTNATDADIQRIIDLRVSPLNISVHTTDPELRVRMLANPRAGKILTILRQFADAGIDLRCQIVLCKGFNDGQALQKTMSDLKDLLLQLMRSAFHPVLSLTPVL